MGEFGLYIKVPMENGHEFLAEADTGGQGVVRATRGESVVKSSVETFEGSLSRVREIAEVILDKLSGLELAWMSRPVSPSLRGQRGLIS